MHENETTDHPPSYTEATATATTTDTNDFTENVIIEPTILVLAGQTIHAESASSSPPLYHLDRGIASLTSATSQVTLERVERNVRTSADNEPTLRERRRHVFTLEHPIALYNTYPSNCPRFFARVASRRHALGHVGLKKSRLHTDLFRALPVDVSGDTNSLGMPGFAKEDNIRRRRSIIMPQTRSSPPPPPLFTLFKTKGDAAGGDSRGRGCRWKWEDGQGNPVAVEDEADGEHRLLVTVPLLRETLDALVALWCCRLWEYSADHTERVHEGMDGGEFVP